MFGFQRVVFNTVCVRMLRGQFAGDVCLHHLQVTGSVVTQNPDDGSRIDDARAQTSAGDPTSASIGIYQYGDDNTFTAVEFIEGNV